MIQAAGLNRNTRIFSLIEVLIIVVLACVPLFLTFPYRVNIFLSWEGAYRLSQGQIPYRDFGMPLGYMYWAIPALFFKIFGTQLITLVKAQVFINILSGLAFRSIFKSLDVQPGIRLLSVMLYCISYSFFNFWPWYNHTVIVYEMIGLAFLMHYIFKSPKWIWLVLSAFFIFCSFFTKQDGGGLAFLLAFVLLAWHCIHEKKWMPMLVFTGSFALVAFAIIAPLTRYNFGYWFNHGQPPHTSRFSVSEIIMDFLSYSQWIKFYMVVIAILMIAYFKNLRALYNDKKTTVFLLLTLGILAEAAVLQVTSYTPPDNNIFYHSFAFVFILSFLAHFLNFRFDQLKQVLFGSLALLLWWSGVFSRYIERMLQRAMPASTESSSSIENIVNRKTYVITAPTGEVPMSEWKFTNLPSFHKIYMPASTVDGITRLMNLEQVKNGKELKVLNMTELTPLAAEFPFQLEEGPSIPLWYHLGVSMFNEQARRFEDKITQKHYDLVLFEHIPSLNNFYPFRVRDSLEKHYQKIDSFKAPRRGDTQGMIEVFIK